MDVKDAQSKVSVSSVSLDSTDCQQIEVLSPEDFAWVDSCLVKDSDIPESTWIPMKNALLEIINSQPQSFSTDRKDIKILPDVTSQELNQESSIYGVEYSSEPSSAYVNMLCVAEESSIDELPNTEKAGTLPSLTFQGNPFLPTYNEEMKLIETEDSGLNLDSSAYEVEDMPENIFKIWDLEIPSEEADLVKQLEKALSDSQMVPPSVDDSGKLKRDLKEDWHDDLISSIADLSLNKTV